MSEASIRASRSKRASRSGSDDQADGVTLIATSGPSRFALGATRADIARTMIVAAAAPARSASRVDPVVGLRES